MVRILFPNCNICSSNDYTIFTRKRPITEYWVEPQLFSFLYQLRPICWYMWRRNLVSLSSLSVFLVPSNEPCSESSCYINTPSRQAVCFFVYLGNSIISLITVTVQMTVSEIDENLNELYSHEGGVSLHITLSYVFIVYYALCLSLIIKRQLLQH